MDEARLSQRERRILAEIEQALSEDVSLERGMRTMSRKRPRVRRAAAGAGGAGRPGRRHALALSVSLLGMLTLGLLVLAVATGEPVLIWAFAAAWVLTLTGLLRLVIRWSHRLRPKSWPN
ncbi:hypothetical protein Q5762_23915 [Streptomyces sp. P9(2023)]|uniref:hypothetical protein n=1 Tax=Streptomyces sp. P9(2023) TaxID=3064394 RepID=UPI0028F43DC7|nr:hypothetical protein [Streptomyces sp. P9(2023)]MDT9691336.1 hypothetical protein [Streptomyces sp. P9(2023)]